MDYLYIVNAFKQQQQQFLLHQQQLQQQLQGSSASGIGIGVNPLTLHPNQHDDTNMANSLLWQPWRDLQQAAAVHHHLYRQQQQQLQQQQQQQQQMQKEARLTSKELPTTAWRRERRLRTGEYHHPPQQQQQHHHHHHHHHQQQHHLASPAGSSASSARGISPCSSPTPIAHGQTSPHSTVTTTATTQLHSNAHQISMMMAAAAAAGMRPLCETTSRPSPPPPPPVASHGNMHIVRHDELNEADMEDAPLDMSVSSSLKQRNSPPPPYREPLPGSQYISTLPRPSVITQAPPKRDSRDNALLANRENDNRSSESIDEHFRRSLGNDYFALFAKKSPASQTTKTPSPQPAQQPPAAHARTPPPVASTTFSALQHSHSGAQSAVVAPPPAYPNILTPAHQQQPNSVLLSPAAILAAHTKGGPADISGHNSPPLPLVVRAPLQQQQQPLALQRATSVTSQTPLPSPQSPSIKVGSTQSPMSSTAGSRTASPLPITQPSSQQSSAITLSRFTSVENSPSSSPGQTPAVVTNVALPNASPTLPAIMRIKTEPGLQSIKTNNPTPPASPTSTTNPNIITEVLASVDDHFAKALGDTWKRLQESKEMRK
ncbi:uncharacterized protein LOC133333237 [Musca vetustissima]|uniref:uncharacterized protein LOC133333237 n=1 Tax=Musca vetustissima TaxID=27455 RepID=UPI002AB65710|nr:uncharacterized protein LOC133333237 [Musca vetustissima]